MDGRANLVAEFNRNLPEENTCSRIGENGEALCNRNGNPDKVTVGVVLPKQSRTGLNTFDICQFQIKLKCQEDKCSFTFYLHSSVCIMRSLSDHKTYLERCGEIKLE